MRRMSYSLYKKYYSQFKAANYDGKTKTIEVEVPNKKRKQFPKSWKRNGNHYTTPGGCDIYFWNSGLAENFEVKRFVSCFEEYHRTITPGIDARDKVLATVQEFENK